MVKIGSNSWLLNNCNIVGSEQCPAYKASFVCVTETQWYLLFSQYEGEIFNFY